MLMKLRLPVTQLRYSEYSIDIIKIQVNYFIFCIIYHALYITYGDFQPHASVLSQFINIQTGRLGRAACLRTGKGKFHPSQELLCLFFTVSRFFKIYFLDQI